MHQKVTGSIPGQGIYLSCKFDPGSGHIWEATDRCFSLSISKTPTNKTMKRYQVRVNKNSTYLMKQS